MSNNTYWGVIPSEPEIIEPGEHTDGHGSTNDYPAIWMGDCLVEGIEEAWTEFATRVLARFNDAGLEEIQHLLRKWEAETAADIDQLGASSAGELIAALLRYAGVEADS